MSEIDTSQATIPSFAVSDNPSTISAALDDYGCAVIHHIFTSQQCKQISAELAPYRATHPGYNLGLFDPRIRG